MGARLIYKDVAIGADADAAFSAPDKKPFANLDLAAGYVSEPYYTLEQNHWLLNGEFYNRGEEEVAYWSDSMSDENCEFANPPVITIDFDNQYSTMGLSILFNSATGDYCNDVDISWYQGSTLKASGHFEPDSVSYFCSQEAIAWNKIVITLNKTSLPYRYAKIEQIVFGIIREFGLDELRSASVTNETNLISAELPDSTLDFELNNKEIIDFMFQLKQPIEARDGSSLLGVYYIESSNRKGVRNYTVSAKDAIGVLSEQNFDGGAYLSGISAKTLVSTIVGGLFDVEYGDGVVDTTLYGVLLSQDKRSALQQVLFAWGVYATTDGGYSIKIKTQSGTARTISETETYQGVSVSRSAIITQARVVAHTYTADSSGSVKIGNNSYKDTETVYTVNNPDVTVNDKQNVKEVKDATLVSTHNGQAVAQRVYDYYSRRETHSSKVLMNGEQLGDELIQPTPWETTITGNVEYMHITLSHIVAADIESLGVEA